MRKAAIEKCVPIIGASDRRALWPCHPDLNRSEGYTDRPTAVVLRTVGNRNNRARALRGEHDDRIRRSFVLYVLDQDLNSRFKILFDDARNRVLAE